MFMKIFGKQLNVSHIYLKLQSDIVIYAVDMNELLNQS